MLLMNRNSGFSIDCCSHPIPSLAMRAMLVPKGEGLIEALQLAFFAQAFAFFAVFAHEFARERVVAFDAEDFAA